MNPLTILVIAGEPSGDLLAAELVASLRTAIAAAGMPTPAFFGAGGPRMAKAGVSLQLDLTRHSVIGPGDVIRKYAFFRRTFWNLMAQAEAKRPDLVLLVDYSHFNHKFAAEIRKLASDRWHPRIVKYVSPQVWASRPGRASVMARDFDLLLCIFPFEPGWYARRVPHLPTTYVGHPVLDRYPSLPTPPPRDPAQKPLVLLLPGSREGELRRHLPVVLGAAERIAHEMPVRHRMILPREELQAMARRMGSPRVTVDLQVGGLAEGLAEADVAIASTGSVTMECARFGVPTVAFYRTSWLTYQIAKRVVQVSHLAMPNLLANREVFPEFVQGAATPANLANEALALLRDPARCAGIRGQLEGIIRSLGPPGAAPRAAQAILSLLTQTCQSTGGPT
jgi:lipid-A-disaccharide synthase